MHLFLIVVAIVIAILVCVKITTWTRMPRKSSSINMAAETKKKVNKTTTSSNRKQAAIVALSADIARDMKIFPYSKKYELEVSKMLVAMDKKVNGAPMTVDWIYLQQIGLSFASIGAAFLLTAAMSIPSGAFVPFGMLAILTAPILFMVPLWKLRGDFKQEQLMAMSLWIEFYNMYYTQFAQREANSQLIDVVTTYLPLANEELAKMIKRFRTDILNFGDEVSVDKFKDRYPDNIRIHKFVSVAKMRMNGDESSYDMLRSVQDDLLTEEDLAYTKYLKAMTKKVATVIDVCLYVGIALLFGVMIYAMVT